MIPLRSRPVFPVPPALVAAALVMTTALPRLPATTTLEQVMQAVTKLEEQTRRAQQETGVPGIAIGVVFQDKIVFARGFGVREAGKPDPVDPDTVFQLASISKPVGSTVIASLVGRGVVRWNSRMADLDPGFALFDPEVTAQLTLADLYAHRSGLPGHIGDILEDLGFPRTDILHRLRYQPPAGTFRKFYAYTNFGLTAAALAAARPTGLSWEELSEQELYRPAGMTSTSSRFSDFVSRPNRASGHQRSEGRWVHLQQRQPDAQTPAGGVSSNVTDMARWMRLQINGGSLDGRQLIPSEALAETHQPHMVTDTGGHYGYGWNVDRDAEGRLRLSHSGAFALGAATTVTLSPEEKLGIVVLTNGEPIGLAEGLAATFIDNALRGAPRRDWMELFRNAFASLNEEDRRISRQYETPPTRPAPALPATAYVGDYANAFHGPLSVTEEKGSLFLHLGPDRRAYPLSHWDGNTFTYLTDGESAAGTSGVIFAVTGDRAASVRVEFLDRNANGTFVRSAGAD